MTDLNKSAFDTYIVSYSNSEFFNKAKKIAYERDGSLNPAVIYGPNMVGKTHLLNAIIEEYRKNGLNYKYMYGSDLVEMISKYCKTKNEKLFDEWERYDLLIIDNAHEFPGKPATQKFIGDAIVKAVRSGTQVVFATDRHLNYYESLKSELAVLPNTAFITIDVPDLALKKKFLEKC